MSHSARGLRLLKSLEYYAKTKPNYYDSKMVLNKIILSSASNGRMLGSFVVDSSMCNGMDTLHGGYISSLVDIVASFAQVSCAGGKQAWTTHLQVYFLKPALKGETILIETNPVKCGSQPIMEAILKSQESGLTIAKGTVTLQVGNDVIQKMCTDVFQFDFNLKD